MSISASDVAELRRSTGAGLMDCKKALQESNGDYEGALDYLRKKGQKVAEKRADKDANEGVVVALLDSTGKTGIVMGLSCETDFVAKNEIFIELANKLAKLALDSKVDSAEALMALPFDGMTVEEKLVDQTGKTGEKIVVSAFHRMSGEHLSTYIHAGAKIGVLLSYKDGGKPDADQFFRSLAMHIAAMNPSIMHYSEFDSALVEKETESFRSRIQIEYEDFARLGKPLKNVPEYVSRLQLTPEVLAQIESRIKSELLAEGKPEKMLDKIVPGKLERFIADNTLLDQERCLLNQFFALDDTKTVEAAIKNFSPTAELVSYKRVAVK